MNKVHAIGFMFFGLSSLIPAAHADNPSYSYVLVGPENTDSDNLGKGKGYALEGSDALNDNVFILGSYGDQSYSLAAPLGGAFAHSYSLGAGYHIALNRDTMPLDLVGRLAFADDDLKLDSGSDTKSGYDVGIGLRAMIVSGIEFYGFTDHSSVASLSHDHSASENVYSAGVVWEFTKAFAVTAEYKASSLVGAKLVGLHARWQW